MQKRNAVLQARALENISYVCGVNRIGKDVPFCQDSRVGE